MKTEYLLCIVLILMLIPSVYAQATRGDAVMAIQQAEQDIQEMIDAGFSVKSVNDSLVAARQALERADFAESIRKNATGELAEKARKALEGLNYEGFTYEEVLKYTQEMAERKQQAYTLSDSIRALEIKTEDYKNQGINTSEAERILENAKIVFEKERYGETETLLSEANSDLENKKAELTTINIVVKSGKGFIEKNWRELSIIAVVILTSGWLGWRKFRIKRIKEKLKKLKIEKESLLKLMKKSQEERFREGKISESIYNLRMEKYNEKLNEVKRTIPVLEAMLKN